MFVDGPLLLPEVGAILYEDVAKARAIATNRVQISQRAANCVQTLRPVFTADDLEEIGARLSDAIIAWDDGGAVLQRVNEHHAAGADHVCTQVISPNPQPFPREQWRRIADAFGCPVGPRVRGDRLSLVGIAGNPERYTTDTDITRAPNGL